MVVRVVIHTYVILNWFSKTLFQKTPFITEYFVDPNKLTSFMHKKGCYRFVWNHEFFSHLNNNMMPIVVPCNLNSPLSTNLLNIIFAYSTGKIA